MGTYPLLFCISIPLTLPATRDLEEARNAYRRALEIDSRNSVSIAYLGKIHFLMGDIDIAITRYHEVNPKNLMLAKIGALIFGPHYPKGAKH